MGLTSFFKKVASPITGTVGVVKDQVGMVKVAHDAEELLELAREMGLHKEWYKSRTMWFNLIAALVELTQHVGGLHVVPDEYVAIALMVGNGALRLLTVSSISKDQAIAMATAAINALPKGDEPTEEGK